MKEGAKGRYVTKATKTTRGTPRPGSPAQPGDTDNWNDFPKSWIGKRLSVKVDRLTLSDAREIAEGTEVRGSHDGGVALARAAASLMGDVRLLVGSDARWADARAKGEFQDLAQALLLTESLWQTVRLGLAAANAKDPSPWQKATVARSAKIARMALRELKKVRPEFGKLWQKLPEAHEVADCVAAWREALPLIEAATKARPSASTEAVVRDVITNNPPLGVRLRLDDAIKNARQLDVFDIVRSAWGKGRSGIRKAPREIAFEVTRWACGLGSAKAVQHAYEFDKGARKIDV